jgi:hypothetical protein
MLPSIWQEYLACVLLHLILPLLPIGIEWYSQSVVKAETLTISTSMYAIAIGVSSIDRALFSFTIVVSITGSAVFGMVIGKTVTLQWLEHTILVIIIIFLFIAHALERYRRHIILREPFFPNGRSDY